MSQTGNNYKSCLTCGKALKGRPDKKFCNDGCRNSYNNRLKSERNNLVRNVNNALAKNRRILETLLPVQEETARANKEKLLKSGFQFKYNTHTYTTKTGKTYFYCYEYGYLPLDNDWFLIVKAKAD
jgi:predicted nucleic acid-binding Zn ribbon protein